MGVKEEKISEEHGTLQENAEKYLTFNISREEYAVPIRLVQEVIRLSGVNVTKVPRAEEYIAGIMNLRGKVIPLISLGKKLGLESDAPDEARRVIVSNFDDRTMGLIVDAVREVISIGEASIESLPEITVNIDANFLLGISRVNDKLISLIDLEKVIPKEGGVTDGHDQRNY